MCGAYIYKHWENILSKKQITERPKRNRLEIAIGLHDLEFGPRPPLFVSRARQLILQSARGMSAGLGGFGVGSAFLHGASLANQADMWVSAVNHTDYFDLLDSDAVKRGTFGLLSMDERRNFAALEGLWTKAFQIASRRDVITASLVGLCGLGLFMRARRCLALTPAERRLLQESGIDRFCIEEY